MTLREKVCTPKRMAALHPNYNGNPPLWLMKHWEWLDNYVPMPSERERTITECAAIARSIVGDRDGIPERERIAQAIERLKEQ